MGFYLIIGDFNVPAQMILDHQFPGAYRRVEYRGEQPSRAKARNLMVDYANGDVDVLVAFAFLSVTPWNRYLFSDGRQIDTV